METIESLKAEIARLRSAWHVETLERKDALIAKQEAENDRLKAELAEAHRATHATDISLQNVIAELDGLKAQEPRKSALDALDSYIESVGGVEGNGWHDAPVDGVFLAGFEAGRKTAPVPAQQSLAAPHGFVIVPSKPSAEMIVAGDSMIKQGGWAEEIYAEMLHAAPTQQSPRITEQDAREIAISGFRHMWHGGGRTVETWLEEAGFDLLAKLNGVTE